MENLVKSCAGIEKKRSNLTQSVGEVVTESKERSSTSGSSYESSSSTTVASSSPPPPPSQILGWPIRKASFRKNSKENVNFDHKKSTLHDDSGFKGKEMNIGG